MGWLIGKRRTRGGCGSRKSTWRGSMRRASSVLVLAVVALASVMLLSAPTQSLLPVARADTPRLTIIVPHPADKHTYGPVGTNVTVRAEGMIPSSAYTLGYARADIGGCTAAFQPFQNVTGTAGADGKFTTTITWPADINSVGVTYYICAQSTTQVVNIPTQSDETFRVDAANAPSVNVAAATGASSDGGTPPVSQPPDGSFYRGSSVTVTGQNFVPGDSTLVVAVSAQQLQQPADFQAAAQKALSVSGGGRSIKSQPSGDISATVKLPDSLVTGTVYLYVFSTDGADQAIPSLVASRQITIAAAPTPQPTATTAPTATSSNGTSPSPGGTSGTPHNLLGIIALAGLSILLFIVGVISLLSAASMPGPDHS